jgi:hypothetical protein
MAIPPPTLSSSPFLLVVLFLQIQFLAVVLSSVFPLISWSKMMWGFYFRINCNLLLVNERMFQLSILMFLLVSISYD